MRGTGVLLGAFLTGLAWVGTAAGQEIDPPYPGAVSLPAEREFQRSQVLAAAASVGWPAEAALFDFWFSAFATGSPPDSVAIHLGKGAAETFETEVQNPDSLIPAFLGSLDEAGLDDLASAVGSDISGTAYRDALLAQLAENRFQIVQYHFIAHEHEDGSLTYYEIHRPYLDVGRLEWIDATRIRVTRHFVSNQ